MLPFSPAGAHAGKSLGQRGLGLVYGGSAYGCMGAVADGFIAAKAHTVGVLPRFMEQQAEVGHRCEPRFSTSQPAAQR